MIRVNRTELTRKEIVRCAANRFLKDGYTAMTVASICKALNMSTGNLTFHHPSKEHMLAELVDMLCGFQWELMKKEAAYAFAYTGEVNGIAYSNGKWMYTPVLQLDQSDATKLAAADWMTASYVGKKTDGDVNLNFKHLLTKVTVNITEWNTEFDGAEKVITDPKIHSKGTEITISYGADGANEYTSDGTLTAITPVSGETSFTALVN